MASTLKYIYNIYIIYKLLHFTIKSKRKASQVLYTCTVCTFYNPQHALCCFSFVRDPFIVLIMSFHPTVRSSLSSETSRGRRKYEYYEMSSETRKSFGKIRFSILYKVDDYTKTNKSRKSFISSKLTCFFCLS